jgi:hypothetical protein
MRRIKRIIAVALAILAVAGAFAQVAGSELLLKELHASYAKLQKAIQDKSYAAFMKAIAPPKAGAQAFTEKQFKDALPTLAKIYAPLDAVAFLTTGRDGDVAGYYFLAKSAANLTAVQLIRFEKVGGDWKVGSGASSSSAAEADKKAQALKLIDSDPNLRLKK